MITQDSSNNLAGVTVDLQELLSCRSTIKHSKTEHSLASNNTGAKKSIRRGRGMNCIDMRHYANGDEVRHMEWRATARSGKPHVKVYEEEKERSIILVTDFNNTMYFGSRGAFKSVIAARLSALLGWFAHDHGEYLGTWLVSDIEHRENKPSRKTHEIVAWLKELACYTQKLSNAKLGSNINLQKQILKKLQLSLKPGSVIIFIGDFYNIDEHVLKQWRILNMHQRLMIFQIFDPLELAPPPANNYPIIIDDVTQSLLLTHAKVRHAYQEFCTHHSNHLKNWCMKNSIDYHPVTHTTDLPQLAVHSLARRAHG